MFFLTAIFLQQVRGDSALQAGLHFLPMGFAAVIGATVASQVVTRVGTRPVQLVGALLSVVGLVLLAQADATGSFASEILPGTVVFGVGIMGIAVAGQIGAIADVRHDEAGAASGLVSAGYQIGGALGLAIATTVAGGASDLTDAFHRGLLVAATFALVNVAMAFVAPRIAPTADQLTEAAAA
jgi:predicted MFS family arabinose efflux permease